MFRFLQSKKGMTLVELLVVIGLLSLGFVALGNLVKITYRSFAKAEERYVKQEAVKHVVEYLQKGTNITAATSCELRQSPDCIQEDTKHEFAYLYTEFKKDTENPEKTGYYLYILDKGMEPTAANCLNPDTPVCVWFEPLVIVDEATHSSSLAAGVNVKVAAVEKEFDYGEAVGTRSEFFPTGDDIFYELDVTYHFPNMVDTNKVVVPVIDESAIMPLGTADFSNMYFVTKLTVDSMYKGDNANVDMQSGALCFIATASYGRDSGEVGLLCEFRDKCLLTNPLGTAFVKAYYKLSPPIADIIRESEPLKAAVRVALKPLVVIATNALDSDLAAENAPWFIVFVLCGAGSTAMAVKLKKQRKKAKE